MKNNTMIPYNPKKDLETNYYNKTEVELLVAGGSGGSIDLSNYYKKLETYSKAQVDALVAGGGADLSDYYTKAEVDGLLDSISLDDYYTKTQTEVLLSNKVEKEDGKGLSTNDFTNTFKQAYDGHLTSTSNPHNVTALQVGAYSKSENDNLLIKKANLDINNKIPLSEIPDSILGQLKYMGVWDFSSGFPTGAEKGNYWITSVSGNGYEVGDWAVYNGTSFDKVDNTDAVSSVAGRTGNVVLNKNDVELNNVDNTSDLNKPISTATQTALDTTVKLTGNQTVAGVKTFTSSPIVPTPTTNTQAANKQYVDGKYSGFKNYIINGGFDIWQRGGSFTGGNKYTADRFKLQSNSTTDTHTRVDLGGNNYAVRVTRGSDGSYNNLFQIIENGKNRLLGKTVTVSCKARASKNVNLAISVYDTNNGNEILNRLTSSVGITTEWTRVSVTFTIDSTPNLTYPNLRVSTFDEISSLLKGDWVEVTGVQLEEGSVATPFENRPYGLELSLCQRYYEKSGLLLTRFIEDYPTGYWKVNKRVPPTLSLSIGVGSGATVIPNICTDLTVGFYQNTPNSVSSFSNVIADAEL